MHSFPRRTADQVRRVRGAAASPLPLPHLPHRFNLSYTEATLLPNNLSFSCTLPRYSLDELTQMGTTGGLLRLQLSMAAKPSAYEPDPAQGAPPTPCTFPSVRC